MMQSITAAPSSGGNFTIHFCGTPNECPVCQRSINLGMVHHVFHGSQEDGRLQIIFQCPAKACERLYIVTYTPGETDDAQEAYTPDFTETVTPSKAAFDHRIAGTSPAFVNIYNQALAAETYGLDHAAGPTYRKALEFLIKDFLCQQKPDKAEAIRAKHLGQCVQEDVEDQRIKTCAERAVWLGNDFTHYTRKYTSHDVEDMKSVILLTTWWISSVLETDHRLQTIHREGS
jgi:hypothetical protein